MAPHAELPQSTNGPVPERSTKVKAGEAGAEVAADVSSQPQNDYYYTYDNRDGYTPETLGSNWQYTVAEHILWAPRKIRVASIGAGASGIMLCYKMEKEFGSDIDLVVYDREDRSISAE